MPPASPVLAGKFFTTEPPGKSSAPHTLKKAWEDSTEGKFKMEGLLQILMPRNPHSSDIRLIHVFKDDFHLFSEFTLTTSSESKTQIALLKQRKREKETKILQAMVRKW